jgi:hypothetical protein
MHDGPGRRNTLHLWPDASSMTILRCGSSIATITGTVSSHTNIHTALSSQAKYIADQHNRIAAGAGQNICHPC